MRLTPKTIVGALLLVWGINIAISAVFPIHLPIFSLLMAAGLIYLGYRVITGQGFVPGDGDGVPSAGAVTRKFQVLFSRERIDLRTIQLPGSGSEDPLIHIDCIFGETIVVLDPGSTTTVRLQLVFAEARTPDDDLVVFGTLNYSTPLVPGRKFLIEANVIFGSVKIVTSER